METLSEITPAFLFMDNHSVEAFSGRSYFYFAREINCIDLYGLCCDSRKFVNPTNSLILKTISASGNPEFYVPLWNERRARTRNIVSHFAGNEDDTLDMDLIARGVGPVGCGGLVEKGKLLNGEKPKEVHGVVKYVDKRIKHPDPVVVALRAAAETTKYVDKPILAANQNHITGTMFPIALFTPRALIMDTKRLGGVLDGEYNPQRIYGDGMPVLKDEELPDATLDMLEKHGQYVKSQKIKYPNLNELQRVQNPGIVIITSGVKSKELRYPATFSRPGSGFVITSPRLELKDFNEPRDPKLEEVLAQLEYPIKESTAHFGHNNRAFSDTYTLYIETGSLPVSIRYAETIVREKFIQDWLNLPSNPRKQVIVAEMVEGIIPSQDKIFKFEA